MTIARTADEDRISIRHQGGSFGGCHDLHVGEPLNRQILS
jgi:hypothetical protein